MKKLTKDEIEYYYNELNYSQEELSSFIGCSVFYLRRLLKDLNIKKDIKKHQEKIKQIKEQKYGDANYNNREKSKRTCLEKYGVDNPFKDTDKMKESYIRKFGVEHPMKNKTIAIKTSSKINYSESIKKGRETYFKKTGYKNPSYNPECIKKGIQTKIKNGDFDSPGTSFQEERLKKLLERKFKHVIQHYRDERYSRKSGYMFECDFYIPSEDLFIELNAHPSHGTHPFKSKNKKDELQMKNLLESDKKWDKAVYETWCIRDVEKTRIAKENNLNYIVLYPNSSIDSNCKNNNSRYRKLITYLVKKLNA